MEKKHREIIVDGIQYGWIVNHAGTVVTVYEDKEEAFTLKAKITPNEDGITGVTPKYVAESIREANKALAEFELMETLDKEWSAFLDTIPWNDWGLTIAESNKIFKSRRRKWMNKMIKKYNCSMALLLVKYKHD